MKIVQAGNIEINTPLGVIYVDNDLTDDEISALLEKCAEDKKDLIDLISATFDNGVLLEVYMVDDFLEEERQMRLSGVLDTLVWDDLHGY